MSSGKDPRTPRSTPECNPWTGAPGHVGRDRSARVQKRLYRHVEDVEHGTRVVSQRSARTSRCSLRWIAAQVEMARAAELTRLQGVVGRDSCPVRLIAATSPKHSGLGTRPITERWTFPNQGKSSGISSRARKASHGRFQCVSLGHLTTQGVTEKSSSEAMEARS